MSKEITSSVVNEALEEGNNVNRDERVAKLQRELAKVQKDIKAQKILEKRYALVQRAYGKLRRNVLKTLTSEEYQAVDGMYLFIHSGNVDMVRRVPSATSRGEDTRLESDLELAEELQNLQSKN